MTPEWSRRMGLVLDSPYFMSEDLRRGKSTIDIYIERMRERSVLQAAMQAVESRDDISDEMRELFDRAEEVAIAAREDFEHFAQNDVEGYGRFLTEI